MSIPKLLVYRLPPDFHERLENWGDVMRSRGGYGVSPTYEICRMLARKAGKLPRGEEPEKELNEADAGFIEAAWRNSVYRMLHQHREILRAHYVQKAYWKLDMPRAGHQVARVRRHAGARRRQLRRFCCAVRNAGAKST